MLIRANGIHKLSRRVIVLLSMFFFLNLVFSPDTVLAKEQEDRFWDTDTMIGVLIVIPIAISLALILYQKRSKSSKIQLNNEDENDKTITRKNKFIKEHFSLGRDQVVFHW